MVNSKANASKFIFFMNIYSCKVVIVLWIFVWILCVYNICNDIKV